MQLNPEQQKEVEKRIHRSACFQRVFKGADGELTLKEIDIVTNYRNNTFDPDPYQSAYNCGQRSISVFIHNVLEQDTEKATQMLDGIDKNESKDRD